MDGAHFRKRRINQQPQGHKQDDERSPRRIQVGLAFSKGAPSWAPESPIVKATSIKAASG